MLAGSEDTKSDVGGVLGTSAVSSTGGGGSPSICGSVGMDGAGTGGSAGASLMGAARGAFAGAGAGAGLLNMLAQLRVPSGFELGLVSGFGSSTAGG